jgi:hypothetical protein
MKLKEPPRALPCEVAGLGASDKCALIVRGLPVTPRAGGVYKAPTHHRQQGPHPSGSPRPPRHNEIMSPSHSRSHGGPGGYRPSACPSAPSRGLPPEEGSGLGPRHPEGADPRRYARGPAERAVSRFPIPQRTSRIASAWSPQSTPERGAETELRSNPISNSRTKKHPR